MRRSKAIFLVMVALFASLSLGQDKLTASDQLEAAKVKAKAEGKGIIVVFGASWCKWCLKLRETTSSGELKDVFERNFVIVPVTVLERGPTANLETPGGDELRTFLGGGKSGIPFYAVLNAEGKMVVNSLWAAEPSSQPRNIGYPGAPAEIDYFIAFLRKGNPKLSGPDEFAIRAYLAKPIVAPPPAAKSP